MAASYSSSRQFPGEYDTIFDALTKATMHCGFTVTRQDKTSGMIEAKTEFSDISLGEKIIIQLHKDGRVTLKSKCILPTQLFSWGKNKQNISKILMMANSLLGVS